MPITPDQQTALRTRRKRQLSVLLLALACGLPLAVARARRTAPTAVAPVAPAAEQLPCLSLSGPSRTIGHDHGLRLRDMVAHNLDDALDAALRARASSLPAAAAATTTLIKHLPQQYVDELRGLAEGAGRSYEEIVALNAWPELAPLGSSLAYAASRPLTRAHDLILGYALDGMPTAGAPERIVLAADPEGARPWIGVAFGGMIGPLVGFNRDGLGVALVVPEPQAPPAGGLPALILVRRLLDETGDLAHALKLIERCPRAGRFELVVAQTEPDDRAVVVEARPDKVATRPAPAGWAIASGTFRRLREHPADDDQTGLCERYDRLRTWLAEHTGEVDGRSDPVAQAGLAGDDQALRAVLEPASRRLALAPGGPSAAASEPLERYWDADHGEVSEKATTRERP